MVLMGGLPVLGMVLVQVVSAGSNILYQVAILSGMHSSIIVVYRYLAAAVSLAPLAFFFERDSRTNLTWKILMQSFFCGLFGATLPQNLFLASMKMTSATFSTSIINLLPAITFVLVILLRLERLQIKTVSGQAKVIGTIVGISGAMLLTFYRGPKINLWPMHFDLLKGHGYGSHHAVVYHKPGSHILGAVLAFACTFCVSIWLIIQAVMSNVYPYPYSVTVLMCFMASVQSLVYALCMERDWIQWKVGFDIKLLTIIYTGVLGSGMIFSVQAWCIKKKGPLFASVFTPLLLVIVALLGSLLLNEKLYLGSILGAVVIIAGLYIVLFGQGREAAAAKNLALDSKKGSVEVVIVPRTSAEFQ